MMSIGVDVSGMPGTGNYKFMAVVMGTGLSRNSVCLTQPAHFSEFLPILHA